MLGLVHTEHHGCSCRAGTRAGQGGIGIWVALNSKFLRAFSSYLVAICSCGTFKVWREFALSLNSAPVILSSKINVTVSTQMSKEDTGLVRQ